MTPVVQLARRGPIIGADAADIDAMRRSWEIRRYVHLPSFLDTGLLDFVIASTAHGTFDAYHHPASGSEQRLTDTPGIALLDFLMNDPQLLRLVEAATATPQLGMFHGRIYRLSPGTDEGHDWHGDHMYGREVGVSINLTREPYEGGRLQLRSADTHQPISEIANTGFGDAVLFRLADDLEHRVLPVSGRVPRVAYAGWFYAGATLKERLDRLSGNRG